MLHGLMLAAQDNPQAAGLIFRVTGPLQVHEGIDERNGRDQPRTSAATHRRLTGSVCTVAAGSIPGHLLDPASELANTQVDHIRVIDR
jgi:hypothetical protein